MPIFISSVFIIEFNYWDKEMKKNFLLVFCIAFFMFNCSDLTTDEEERQGRETDRNGGDGPGGSAVNVCPEHLYPIHSGECDENNKQAGSESTGSGMVDILFVLDTSSDSMKFYLNSKRFEGFISIINNLSWRMIFTNAGHSDSSFDAAFNGAMNGGAMKLENRRGVFNKNYLDRTVKSYKYIFKYTITREPDRTNERGTNQNKCSYPPYCQDAAVQPLRALHASFKANKELTRNGADFVAVIISNTDEEPESGASDITAQEIADEFQTVYGSGKKLSVLSLIILPGDESCKKKNDAIWFADTNEAHQIAAAVTGLGGRNFDICLRDYSIVARHIVDLAN